MISSYKPHRTTYGHVHASSGRPEGTRTSEGDEMMDDALVV